MKPRPVEDWLAIIKGQTDGKSKNVAARIFGDILGYGSLERTIKNRGWRERDEKELANALEAYHLYQCGQ